MSRIWIGLIAVMATAVTTVGAQQPGTVAPRPEAAAAPPGSSSASAPARGGSASSSGAASKPRTPPRVQAAAGAETLPVLKAGTPEHARVICRVDHVPVSVVARTIGQLLHGEGQLVQPGGAAAQPVATRTVVLVPEAVGNRLLLAGPPDAVEEVRRLIEELDQPKAMLVLEVVVGEAPVSPEKRAIGSRKDERTPSVAAAGAAQRRRDTAADGDDRPGTVDHDGQRDGANPDRDACPAYRGCFGPIHARSGKPGLC